MSGGVGSEVHVFVEQDMSRAMILSAAGGVAAVFSAKSPQRESENEDAAAVIVIDEHRSVLAVADGVGGHAAGAEAARVGLTRLTESLMSFGQDDAPLHGAVVAGFEAANAAVMGMGVGAATTLAVVEIDHEVMRSYHAGDTMVLVLGQRGRIRLQTISHSPVGYALESGLLEESEAIHHEDRHLVSNLLGSSEMRIEINSPLNLKPRDTIVIGSDGLFDNLHVHEVIEIVRKGPLDRAADALAAACAKRMTGEVEDQPSKPDDLSFILFRPGRTP